MKKSKLTNKILTGLLIIAIFAMLTGCIKIPQHDESSFEDEFGELEEGLDEIAGKAAADTQDTAKEDITAKKSKEKTDEKIKQDEEIKETEEKEEEEADGEKSSRTEDSGIPVKIVVEGETVSFPNLKAKDPEGQPITYTFSKPLDKNGQWRTQKGDAGEYIVTITASDGEKKATQQVKIIVKPLNNPPVLVFDKTEIKAREGDILNLDATATDADGDEVTITCTSDITNTCKFTLGYDAAGTHEVVITASDGKEKVSKTVTLVVQNVNRAPRIEPIETITVKEGEKVILKPKITDADGDKIKVTYSKPLNSDGEWQTLKGDAGLYEATVTASDGELSNTANVKIVVKSTNQPPVIKLDKSTLNVNEGDTVEINPVVTDPEDDLVTIKYSGWMKTNTKKTGYDDAGTHIVTITADDGYNTVELNVTIVVRDVNRPPVFDPDAFK